MSEEQLTKKERKALKKQEQEENKRAEALARRNRAKNRTMIITISAIVIIGFLFWLIQNAPEGPSLLDDTPETINVVDESDHVKGAPIGTGEITIIEYSDFQCPACAAYYPLLSQIVEDFGDRVTFVYRHLPIRTIHPNAELASRYVEAAGLQNKFFEMHDIVFDNQAEWSFGTSRAVRSMFEGYAETLELDIDKLVADVSSEAVISKIEQNRIDAIGAGVVATPSFFIDGELLAQNPGSYEEFVELITGESPAVPERDTSLDISEIQNAIADTESTGNETVEEVISTEDSVTQ